MAEKEIYLYKITNPRGRIYIGQTVNPRNRFIVYARNDTRAQKRLGASISKYGWDAHSKEIITSFPKSQIDYAEKYMIAYHNTTGKNGLNIMPGGAIHRTDEMNKKHSMFMKGRTKTQEFKNFISSIMKGNKYASVKRTHEFKLRMSKPFAMYNSSGDFIKKYDYISQAVQDGFCSSSVNKVCNGHHKQHKGFIFKYI